MHGWATLPEAWQEVQYRLEISYNVDTHSIDGVASIHATWHGLQPVTALHFFLPPNTLQRRDPREPAVFSDSRYPKGFTAASLTVHQVTDGGRQALPFALQDDPAVPIERVPDQALLVITLPRPYQPGEPLDITIAFTTRLPQAKNWGYYRGIVALDGLWYPMLVPVRQGAWGHGLQEFVHAHYTLHLTTAADQHVVASVPWTQRTVQAGQQTLVGSAGPLYHLGLSLSRRWHQEADQAHEPPLHVLVPTADAALASHVLQTLRTVLAFYHREFALTLSVPFTVVVHERDASWPYSVAANNLLFVSRDLLRVPPLVRKLMEYQIARGLASQWWGLQAAYNLNTERWIGEGLTTYLALRWLDDTYGSGRNFLTWKGSWLPNYSYREQSVELDYRRLVVKNHDQIMTTPLLTTPSRDDLRVVYQKKGALVYSMLHDLLGAETFQRFLHRLLETGPLLTSADVQQGAEAISGQELGWFFDQWVAQKVRLDYAVGNVETTRHTDAEGRTVYVNKVEIRRLGEAVMPLTVRLLSNDGSVHDTTVQGTAASEVVAWQSPAPLTDVQLDPERRLPDVQRLNNTAHVPYTVRPLIDFPRLDRYLIYPFIFLESNFIDGYTPRLLLTALYLDDQSATLSIGYKETPNEISIEGAIVRNRFPHRLMSTTLAFLDRQSTRTLLLETSLLLEESHRQQRLPANVFTLGYHVTWLDELEEFNGEPVPEGFAPDTGRVHSVVMRYQRDTRIPYTVGAPPQVFAEPLAYGYALRLEAELASELLGSDGPDFQQVRWDASVYPRLWNQAWIQFRVFGGWSAGTVPLQRKLSLAGINAVRGYDYSLQLLGDRMVGGTASLRLPLLRDIRLDTWGRYFGLRGLHIGPFVDGGWVWDRGEALGEGDPRASAGLRLITEIGFGSLLRFELVLDLAHPFDAQGRREDAALQTWIRLQSTARGGLH
jgi:hypothetical protein